MRNKILLIAAILTQITLFSGCSKEIKKEKGSGTQKSLQSGESVAKRIEYERKIKRIALQAPFIVSIRSRSSTKDALVTGFFVDSRGYVVTARHAYSEPLHDASIEIFFLSDRIPLRVVGEIQTLDMALLATDIPVTFPIATFGDLSKIIERGEYYGGSSWNKYLELEKSMVAVRCVNKDGTPGLDRIVIGELSHFEKTGPRFSFSQLQQDTAGCSGAPIINLLGEVIGMLRSSSGDLTFGIDAQSIKEGARLLIEEDLKRGPR